MCEIRNIPQFPVSAVLDRSERVQAMTQISASPGPGAMSRHRFYEDALALLLGTLFVALGMAVYAQSTLLIGGIAGVTLLLSYVTHWDFGLMFFTLNLPFYILAWKRMGPGFTLRTALAVGLVTLFSRLSADWIGFSHLHPLYAAVIGGALAGVGLLMLFRHRTGLGGINILAFYLQEHLGLRAGYVQLGIDLAILVAAAFVLPFDRLLLSVLGAVVMNLVLALNHKPGRYMGMS